MIRLDAISLLGLPQRSQADIAEPYTVRVNGVLHSGPLPMQQELEVRLNGEPLTGVREGDQQVFSWQWVRASDRVQLVLRSRGVPTKHWQASWDGRTAIMHTGTLPVQVVFDGKVQLPVEAARVNGGHPLAAQEAAGRAGMMSALAVIATAQSPEAMPQDPGATRLPEQVSAGKGEGGTDAQKEQERQGEAEDDGEHQQEQEPESDEANDADRWEDELEVDAGDDDGDCWQDEEDEEDQGEVDAVMAEEDEMERNAAQTLTEREMSTTGERIHWEIRSHADRFSAPTWQVTTAHAAPLAHEQTLRSLQELVELRPKTLIVDVRPKSSQSKRYQAQDHLSKQLLRSMFGAQYWDRGWAIACTSQMIPRGGKIRGASWRYVVNQPERHPGGLPALEQKLAEGYALVIIDSLALYGESRRRAVVEELLRRVPDLTLGPLG